MFDKMRIGHSPDPDDAFMFYGLASSAVTIDGREVEHIMADIETLNQGAFRDELEVTAISAAVYPRVADSYRLLRTGASVGRGYGPKILSRTPQDPTALQGACIAVPGEHTTAFLLIRLYMSDFTPLFKPFHCIPQAVLEGEVDAGLVIHESQVTYQEQGLYEVVDLGQWWQEETGLPIPLGVNVVHRSLGEQMAYATNHALQASIRYAYDHMEEAVAYACQFGRGIDSDTCRQFVQMYVNEDTWDIGPEGTQALALLYRTAHERGWIPAVPPLDIVPFKSEGQLAHR
jgi:1,4-dihydroxy-6-naphthoate synthase